MDRKIEKTRPIATRIMLVVSLVMTIGAITEE
jgi:hypothetical protein